MPRRSPYQSTGHLVESILRRTELDTNPYLKSKCKVFTGSRDAKGYAQVRISGKLRRAHVVVLESLRKRPAPYARALLKCKNPGCVRPGHLQWSTETESKRTAAERLRLARRANMQARYERAKDESMLAEALRLEAETRRIQAEIAAGVTRVQ